METIFDILEKLSKFSKEEIQYGLLQLMLQEKIRFTEINAAYTQYLERIKQDNDLKLSDANTCTLCLLNHFKKENKNNHADIHWALHNLNESKQFQMQTLNEKFGYNKEEDCKFSYYWRGKPINNLLKYEKSIIQNSQGT